MYLFLDTETTGLPLRFDAPASDIYNWPRMIQIAWLLYDDNENLLSEKEYIIKPEGFIIPSSSTKIHRISNEIANKFGHNLLNVLHDLATTIDAVDYVVAHNIGFDEKIIGAEFIRKNMKNPLSNKILLCTMQSSIDFCKIPSKNGYKWPKLAELYFKLFNKDFDFAHNAVNDTRATAACFWELRRKGII